MNVAHCGYRSPIGALRGWMTEPVGWICGCPAGEHDLGRNCIDDQAKCRIAKLYDKTGLPSYRYGKTAAKMADAQAAEVEELAEGLPEELAEIVRAKYQRPKGKV